MVISEANHRDLSFLSQIHGEKCWPLVEKISPCEDACPIHQDVPSYVVAISRGMFKEALDIVRQVNPFPSICGRVCHHPCEDACNRALIDKPVAIQYLKRFAAEYENGLRVEQPLPVERTRKEKIAVIGSGPAGLTAAYDLIRAGYGVTVYESQAVAGGMLATAIPDFILPQEVVRKEVDYIQALGVDIKTGLTIGKDVTLEHLARKGYKAFLLAGGASKSVRLDIPGTDLEEVSYALPLLQAIKSRRKTPLRGKVVIIGGGNTALDTARTAIRLGAQEVHVTCLESRKDMPSYSWEIEKAESEGVKIHPGLAPQRILSGGNRRVSGLEFKRVASTQLDKEGRLTWTLMEGPGSDYSIEADAVVIAIGQMSDPTAVKEQEIKVKGRGAIEVTPETMATNVPGVFAAGDAVVVAGSVVQAIAAGHRAALSIQSYLGGGEVAINQGDNSKALFNIERKEQIPGFLVRKERWSMPLLFPKDAVRSFGEVMLGFNKDVAIEEAKRCLNCRMCGNCVFERGQLCFEASTRLL